VFVERHEGGDEQIMTAQTGKLVPAADGASLQLELGNGLIVGGAADGTVSTWRFTSARINEDFTVVAPPYDPRGIKVRQLTLPELRPPNVPAAAEKLTPAQLTGEFHGRLARTVLPLLLPLLALPLGMAAKRGRRAPGTVFAVLALLALDQSLVLGESMAETGRAIAWLSVWLPVVLFGALGLWLFRSSLQWPGDNPVMRAVSAIETAFEGAQRRRKASHK
ncbi:MAG TPA: LptF/LptG family permease, partial [Steroidobacteraceae bacterium]|nr:LptF/LptG family permease [Steroidobacteraceae bacterium]